MEDRWFEEKSNEMGERLERCKREGAVLAMTRELSGVEDVPPEVLRAIAERVVELGYRKERYAEWRLDPTFEGKDKVRYYCSACGYWRTVKDRNAVRMLYGLRYCPGCGAKMSRPGEEKNEQTI